MRNRSGTLYTGVTNNLQRRVNEQRSSSVPGFTSKYRIRHLVYFEITNNVKEASAREKQIKGWVRKRKIELIESVNPDWEDLSADWPLEEENPNTRDS